MIALLIVGGVALTSFAFVAGCVWNAAHGAHFADQDRADAENLEVRLRETEEREAWERGERRALTAKNARLEARLKLETNRRMSIADQLERERRACDAYRDNVIDQAKHDNDVISALEQEFRAVTADVTREQVREAAEWVTQYGGDPAAFVDVCAELRILRDLRAGLYRPADIDRRITGPWAQEAAEETVLERVHAHLDELLGEATVLPLPLSSDSPAYTRG